MPSELSDKNITYSHSINILIPKTLGVGLTVSIKSVLLNF